MFRLLFSVFLETFLYFASLLVLHIRNEINLYYINLYFGNYIISFFNFRRIHCNIFFFSYKTQREENQTFFLKSEQQLDALNQITNFLLKPSFENLEKVLIPKYSRPLLNFSKVSKKVLEKKILDKFLHIFF